MYEEDDTRDELHQTIVVTITKGRSKRAWLAALAAALVCAAISVIVYVVWRKTGVLLDWMIFPIAFPSVLVILSLGQRGGLWHA